ncbi:TPA: hypothetical protein ACQ317_004175 [Yersinia enterocolitica]|nr:hypothetical protein CBW54_00180 [Yersinia kristensenii]
MATDKPVVIHTDNQEFRKLLDRCTVEGFKFSDNKEFIEKLFADKATEWVSALKNMASNLHLITAEFKKEADLKRKDAILKAINDMDDSVKQDLLASLGVHTTKSNAKKATSERKPRTPTFDVVIFGGEEYKIKGAGLGFIKTSIDGLTEDEATELFKKHGLPQEALNYKGQAKKDFINKYKKQ